ncbi:hypothetical protein F2Q70_00003675 [Brassica cretica]|uniref:Uncharacterized protein n=1 Tax=Brassica cretica TaxID=69181 RepID=A0A8S9INM5_BRACR|nr:hypothetical protein F2Q70_00003675 [Brassica cretica]
MNTPTRHRDVRALRVKRWDDGFNHMETRPTRMTNPDRRVTAPTVPENQRTDRLESEQEQDTEEQPKNSTGENSMSFTQEIRTSATGRSRVFSWVWDLDDGRFSILDLRRLPVVLWCVFLCEGFSVRDLFIFMSPGSSCCPGGDERWRVASPLVWCLVEGRLLLSSVLFVRCSSSPSARLWSCGMRRVSSPANFVERVLGVFGLQQEVVNGLGLEPLRRLSACPPQA